MDTNAYLEEWKQLEEALAYSRRLFVEGKRSAHEQREPMRKKFGFTEQKTNEIYQGMRDEITREIIEAKQNPNMFALRMWHDIRDDLEVSWRDRITAQTEIDDLFDLVKLAEQPGHWNHNRLHDAWAFYQMAVESETISKTQRLRAYKRLDLLIQGPKRDRRKPAAIDRRNRQMGLNDPPTSLATEMKDAVASYHAALAAEQTASNAEPTSTSSAEASSSGCGTAQAAEPAAEVSRPAKSPLSQAPNARPASTPPRKPANITNDSPQPAAPARLVASEPPRDASASRYVESDDDDAPPPQAQPPP